MRAGTSTRITDAGLDPATVTMDGNKSVTATFAQAPRTIWDRVYSGDQAARGEKLYAMQCAQCHGEGLTGVEMAPPLTGDMFNQNWEGVPLSDLFDGAFLRQLQAARSESPSTAGVHRFSVQTRDDRRLLVRHLAEERAHALVDVRLPHGHGPRAGDVAVGEDARPSRVEVRRLSVNTECVF